MKPGDLVDFSGTFLRGSDGDCLEESSLTLEGKVESPDFIFRFASISPYTPSPASEPTTPDAQSIPEKPSAATAYTGTQTASTVSQTAPSDPSTVSSPIQSAQPDSEADNTSQTQSPIIPAAGQATIPNASTSEGVAKAAPELDGDALKAVNLVRSNVEPTDALLALNPDIQHIDWGAVNDSFACNGCWYISAHIRKDKDSTDPVQYFVSPGWNVNIVQHTVQPDADGLKYYTLKVPTAH